MTSRTPGSKLLPALVMALALGVLGGAIWQGSRHLRNVVRGQMVNRDGEILYAVAQSQQFGNTATNLSRRLQNPVEQLALALQISQLKDGVLGVRLFDAEGRFVTAFPPNVTESSLDSVTLVELQRLHPASRYDETARLTDQLLMDPTEPDVSTNLLPLLEVNIPVHDRGQTNLLACAQLILDAHDLAQQVAALDQQLRLQALGAFCAGGTLLTVALVWAYRRLQKSNRLLQERTAHLLRANHELTLASKTGALGAVTAHLIHGLSNPLANVREFVTARSGNPAADEDWRDAMAATQRMQQLIHEVVRVLGESGSSERYEISLAELAQMLEGKVRPLAQKLGVACEVKLAAEGQISNHQANIILLILENLTHNALQVTPRDKRVQTSIFAAGTGVVCQVTDEGTGFPEHQLKNLFMPCRSTKGGAGLGLAISKQLANQLGAQLELKTSGPQGCVITLTLPPDVFAGLDAAPTAVPAPLPPYLLRT